MSMNNDYDSYYYDSENNFQKQDMNIYYKSYISEALSREDCEININDLLKSLELDKEFKDYYYNTKHPDIMCEFSELPDIQKIEMLIKIFYYNRNDKNKIYQELLDSKTDYEERNKKYEAICNEKIEFIKNESYKIKCDLDALKIDNSDLRKLNESLKIDNEKLKLKLKSCKRESSEKYDDQLFKLENQNLKDEIDNLTDEIQTIKKLKESTDLKLENIIIENRELNDKYSKLIMAYNELNDKNRKLEYFKKVTIDSYTPDSNIGVNLEGILLDETINDETKPNIEENIVEMKINNINKLKPTYFQRAIIAPKHPTTDTIVINNETIEKKIKRDPSLNMIEYQNNSYYGSIYSEKDPNESLYNKQGHHSEDSNLGNDKLSEYESYNSYNNYILENTKKNNVEFNTINSQFDSRMSDFIDPNKREYSKEEFPSNATGDNENKYISTKKNYDKEYESDSNYFMSGNENKALTNQNNIDLGYYSGESNVNYFSKGYDPK